MEVLFRYGGARDAGESTNRQGGHITKLSPCLQSVKRARIFIFHAKCGVAIRNCSGANVFRCRVMFPVTPSMIVLWYVTLIADRAVM